MRGEFPLEISRDFRPQERSNPARLDLNNQRPKEVLLFTGRRRDRLGSVLPGMEAPAGMELIRGLKRPSVPCSLVVGAPFPGEVGAIGAFMGDLIF